MDKRKLSIYAICFVTLIYLVISVAIAGLLAAFPNAGDDTVMLILTLPSLTGLIGIILVPLLSRHISLKLMTCTALLLLLGCGVCCILFSSSLTVMITTSVVNGIAYGLLASVYPLITNEYFSGNEKNTVLGIASCMLQLGKLVSTLIGGFLADARWNYVYFTYVFVIIAFIIVFLGLPRLTSAVKEKKPANIPEEHSKASYIKRVLLNKRMWVISATGFFYTVLYFIYSTHSSLYIEGYGLGSASVTGIVMSFTCAVAAAASLFFTKLYGHMKNRLLAVVLLIMGAGYLIPGCLVSLPAIIIGLLLGNISIAFYTPYLMLSITEAADKDILPAVNSIVLIFVNLGYFFSPYIMDILGTIASKLLPADTTAAVYLASGIIALICGLVLLLVRQSKKAE